MKKCKVYGMLAAAPIGFPDEIELRVYPHDKETGLGYGGFYPYSEHRSWRWMQSFIPLVPHAWPEIEQKLKEGACVPLVLGEHSMEFAGRSGRSGHCAGGMTGVGGVRGRLGEIKQPESKTVMCATARAIEATRLEKISWEAPNPTLLETVA